MKTAFNDVTVTCPARKLRNPATPPGVVRIEAMENRRLMSGAIPSAATAVYAGHTESNAYEFTLGRPGEDGQTRFSSHGHPLLARGVRAGFVSGDGDVFTGVYSPRLKLWGHVRDGQQPENDPATEPATAAARGGAGDDGVTHAPPGATPPPPTPPRHHLLLVEDDPASRRAIALILARRGWDVTAVGTLAEGVRELSDVPEAVVLDLTLPDGNGEQLLQAIRGRHLPTCVAVTTGSDDARRIGRLHDLGADAVLVKPVNVAALIRHLPALPETGSAILPAA